MRYVLVLLMLVAVMFAEDKKKATPKPTHPVTYLEALDQLPPTDSLSHLYKASGLKTPKAAKVATRAEEIAAIRGACTRELARQAAADSDFTTAVAQKIDAESTSEYNKLVAQYNELLQRYKDVVARYDAHLSADMGRFQSSTVIIHQPDPALYRTTFHSEPDPVHCSAFTWGNNTSVNCR